MHSNGAAPTFDQARADFEAAWQAFLSKRTEADFQAWPRRAGLDRSEICHVGARREAAIAEAAFADDAPCGVRFDSHRLEHNLVHVPRATEQAQHEDL
jgi:hypothetical protein